MFDKEHVVTPTISMVFENLWERFNAIAEETLVHIARQHGLEHHPLIRINHRNQHLNPPHALLLRLQETACVLGWVCRMSKRIERNPK